MVQENLARTLSAEKHERLRHIKCSKSVCVHMIKHDKE